MADKKRYQVLTAAAVVPVTEPDGTTIVMRTLYRGTSFEADPDNVKIAYNVDSGYIIEIGSDDVVGTDGAGAPMVGDKRQDGNEPGSPNVVNDPGVANETAYTAAAKPTTSQAKPAETKAPTPTTVK